MLDDHAWIDLKVFVNRLRTQRCRTSVQALDRAQVILVAHVLVSKHVDDNGRNLEPKISLFLSPYHIQTYHIETRDLEILDRFQVRLHLKLGQDNNLVASVNAGMAGGHQSVNVALGKKTKRDISVERRTRGSD